MGFFFAMIFFFENAHFGPFSLIFPLLNTVLHKSLDFRCILWPKSKISLKYYEWHMFLEPKFRQESIYVPRISVGSVLVKANISH